MKNYWNKEELLNFANILERKKIPMPLEEYKVIMHDIVVINQLLKSIKNDKKIGTGYPNPFVRDGIIINRDKILDLVPRNLILNYRIPYFFRSKKINEAIERQLFLEFLSEIDYELLEIFDKLIFDNSISLNCTEGEGYVQQLIKFDKFYVSLRDDRWKSFTLVHEIGHIKQLKKCTNMDEIENLHLSLFIETYSKYLELKWAEFLCTKGYNKIGLRIKEEIINNIYIYTERFYDYMSEDIDNKKVFYGNFIINYISYLLSIYFLDKPYEEILKLNNLIISKNNYEVLTLLNKQINKKIIQINFDEFVLNYRNEIYKEKTKKKIKRKL